MLKSRLTALIFWTDMLTIWYYDKNSAFAISAFDAKLLKRRIQDSGKIRNLQKHTLHLLQQTDIQCIIFKI